MAITFFLCPFHHPKWLFIVLLLFLSTPALRADSFLPVISWLLYSKLDEWMDRARGGDFAPASGSQRNEEFWLIPWSRTRMSCRSIKENFSSLWPSGYWRVQSSKASEKAIEKHFWAFPRNSFVTFSKAFASLNFTQEQLLQLLSSLFPHLTSPFMSSHSPLPLLFFFTFFSAR